MTIERELQEMLELRAIATLTARYSRFLDWKQWDEWAALWSDDARIEAPDIGLLLEGKAKIVPAIRETMNAEVLSIHLLHTPELEITGPDKAKGTWRVEDHVHWPPNADGVRSGLHGFGAYHIDYVKEEGEWRLALLRIVRLHVERF